MNKAQNVPPIPRRPLTTYNIFSILERHYILQQNQKTTVDSDDTEPAHHDPYFAERPKKYRHVVLPSNWYVVGMNRKKRQHHKNHGVISFNSLSKMISESWGSADDEVKAYCKKISTEELKRYRHDQAAFKERYGEEAFEAQTRKRKNAEAASAKEAKLCKTSGAGTKNGNASQRERHERKNEAVEARDDRGFAHGARALAVPGATIESAQGHPLNIPETCLTRIVSDQLSNCLPDERTAALALLGIGEESS
ncbi:hypothetical protein HJC23_009334 [Cyclotella cryptica]|uniref:HMG box domain-containing protein n=1 Tax=Cyclotella cryptica TaxID=29204 RepID=A0ABD3QYZ9_9STRA|eukprot:CCRYP_002327-RA/>CCRYP_002327-RA protein AED:0.00 eAED:0.00 QI:378/-1/1/1/-1/1/1/290/251